MIDFPVIRVFHILLMYTLAFDFVALRSISSQAGLCRTCICGVVTNPLPSCTFGKRFYRRGTRCSLWGAP